MFDGFARDTIDLGEGAVYVRHGGSGDPVLLLTVIPEPMPPGIESHRYLASHTPSSAQISPGSEGHLNLGTLWTTATPRRAQRPHYVLNSCRDLIFRPSQQSRHDRGAYTAFRTALDYPDVVSHLGVLDAVAISEALSRRGSRFAQAWWHWFFYAQPEKPELAINRDPLAWYGGCPEAMGAEVYEERCPRL